jgi:4-amino-4-deoxy-L-arabinose transferase-like glycosyltransferase
MLKIKFAQKTTLILALIFAVGLILRTYHFSEWLRFNADQARDAGISISFVEGKTALPLVGPHTGGTAFDLGPIFYHFQILAMKIFGTDPAAAAYPDLFFSLLSIVLFYFLARIYFDTKISLALSWLFAISYFVATYSRFAWNPNSTAFFVMLFLFSIYKIISTAENKKIYWAVLTGISLGIAVQLHASLLIIMPVLSILALIILLRKKKITGLAIAVVMAAAILVNTGQIVNLVQTNGKNIQALFRGAASKNQRNSSLIGNIALNAFCHINANSYALTAFGDEISVERKDNCGFSSDSAVIGQISDKNTTLLDASGMALILIFSVIFSLGGYFLLFRKTRAEKNENKKIFLIIFSAFLGLVFIFFTAWAHDLAIRFFLPVSFVPFILLGLWLDFLSRKNQRIKIAAVLAVLVLTILNVQKIWATYNDLQYGGQEIGGNFEYITLGEVKYIDNFMKENALGDQPVYIDGQPTVIFKAFHSFELLGSAYGIKPVEYSRKITLNSGERYFYLANSKDQCVLADNYAVKYAVDKCSVYRQFSVYALRVK